MESLIVIKDKDVVVHLQSTYIRASHITINIVNKLL